MWYKHKSYFYWISTHTYQGLTWNDYWKQESTEQLFCTSMKLVINAQYKKTEELGLMAEEKISKLSKAKEEKYILRKSV